MLERTSLTIVALLLSLSTAGAQPPQAPRLQVKRAEWKERFDEANAAYKAKEYAKSESLFREALVAARRSDDPDRASAFVLNGLTASLVAQGKFAEAEPLAAESIETWIRVQGAHHPSVGRTLSNLGNIRAELQKFDEAVETHRRALSVFEHTREPGHPEILHAARRLGDLYFDLGRDAEAAIVYRRLFILLSTSDSAGVEPMIHTLNRLARCHLNADEAALAEPLARQALQLCQRGLEPTHPLIADSLATLAMLYSKQGDRPQAFDLIGRSIAVLEGSPKEQEKLWEAEAIRGRIHLEAENWAEAEASLTNAILLLPKRKPTTASVAKLHENAALAYRKLGREDEAQEQDRKANRIRDSLLPKTQDR